MFTRGSDQVLTVIGGVMVCTALGFLISRLIRWRMHSTAHWTAVPANLVEFEIKDARHMYGQVFKVAQVWYKYEVNGKTYGSANFSLFNNAMGWSPAISAPLLSVAVALSKSFSESRTVSAYVDARNPSRSVLVTAAPISDLIDFFVPSIGFCAFGFFSLFIGSWR
jgi:hypothetical protein